ncbi:MAG: methyltransferase FkbM family [Bacteroidetes bacterium]|jgi:FkbM family methyltransferase|nr:methyltransferase FkbM family [Bacteroidota bacterium]
MKNAAKYILHTLLGFKNYLFIFSLFKIYSLKRDKKEKDFFQFLQLIPEGTAVLDIGANIGIMTAHLARIKNSTVFCFEPMPNNIDAFKRIVNHFNLKNVVLFEIALGNTEGEAEMVMPVISSVRMQGLSHVVHESIPENNEGERFKVPLKVLDEMPELINSDKRISAIKIDVENFEFFVLDGAKRLMEKNKPVVYAELWDNDNRYKCFDLFDSLNYKTYVAVDDKLVLFNPSEHVKQNFIFLPA